MDARKFLRAINTSAQSKVVFFESVVKRLGREASRDYRLVALDANSLIFEDVNDNIYFHADVSKKQRGRVEVNNIRPIKVVDEQKSESFEKHCQMLVENLASDDFKSAEKLFRTIETQRFRPSVIPDSGWVTTREGLSHRVQLESEGNTFDIPAITEAFCSAISEFVELDEQGRVIKGVFPESGEKFHIPINETTKRRLVAHHMKEVAENAWKSNVFCNIVRGIAGKVSSNAVQEAVRSAAKFLAEEQEFCMLTSEEIQTLVENALAAQGEFNSILAENVATLFQKVNLRVNRGAICEAWGKTALKAQNSELLHDVKLLESSEDFEGDYDVFLNRILNEGVAVQTARAKAYLTTLKVINSILTKMEGKEDLANQVESMVAELEEPEPSTDIIMEAEQLLCSIPDTLVDRIVTLENFSEIPGEEIAEDEVEPEGPVVGLPMGPEEEAGGEMGGGDLGLGGGEEALPMPEAGEPGTSSKITPVEKMTVNQLREELDSWKTDGHIYIKEDGFDDCLAQFTRLIERCETLNVENLREEFEALRDKMVETGEDVIEDALFEDPYAKHAEAIDSDINIREDYGATMDSPTGKGVAAKSGSEPGKAGKGKAAGGDPKMGKPKGKGVPSKSVGQADFSGSGSTDRMPSPKGKGVQKKGVGDAGLPAENEKDPDDGKPKTGGAEMGRPEGKGVAESVEGGAGEKAPTKDKQYSGSWIDKLDEKMATELKSGDQGDKLSSVSPKVKGGVATKGGKKLASEGTVPDSFKKNWGKGKGDEGGEDDGDGEDKGEKKESGKPWEKEKVDEAFAQLRAAIGENKELLEALELLREMGEDLPQWAYGPYQKKSWEERQAELRQPGEMEPCLCNECGLEEEAMPGEPCPDPECVGTLESQEEARGPFAPKARTPEAEVGYRGEPGYPFESISAAAAKLVGALGGDPSLAEAINGIILPWQHLAEAQRKAPTKGIKPIGYKKSALQEELASENVAVLLADEDSIDQVIDKVVATMGTGAGGAMELDAGGEIEGIGELGAEAGAEGAEAEAGAESEGEAEEAAKEALGMEGGEEEPEAGGEEELPV
jgi:hypothetical protein